MENEEIIKEYQQWKISNNNFTIFDFIGLRFTREHILFFSQLFLPKIIALDGFIFLSESNQKVDFKSFYGISKDMAEVEKSMNFVSIDTVFLDDSNEEKSLEVINILKESWECYFDRKYGCGKIAVETYLDKDDGWTITFYQIKNIKKDKPKEIPSFL